MPNALTILLRGSLLQPLQKQQKVGRTNTQKSYHPVEQTGGGRLYALDLLRFVAMIFMVQGHVLDAMVSTSVIDVSVAPWNFWHAVRGLTAPIFLMVSGAVHAFATKRGSDGFIREDILSKRIRWALTIIGLGYLLVFPANRIWDLPFVPTTSLPAFYSVNILQLTGVTMLLFVLVMNSTRSVAQMGKRAAFTAIGILALTPVAQQLQFLSGMPPWLASYIGNASGSLFPVFPFSAFLFVGISIGAYLYGIPAQFRDLHLKKYAWRFGIVLTAITYAIHLWYVSRGVDALVLEQPMSVLLFVRRVGLVLVLFSASVVVLQYTNKHKSWYSLFGAKSLYIYGIHLVLLFGTPWFNGIARTHYRQFDLPVGLLLVGSILICTLFSAWAIDRVTAQLQSSPYQKYVQPALLLALGYLLLV